MRLSRKLLYDAATLKTELLSTRVCDLGLRLGGTLLEACIDRALEHAAAVGVGLRPFFYLGDGYGCVQGTGNVCLGFWDADPLLREIHHDRRGRTRDELDLVLVLKHEIGHAFCYTHKLYTRRDFRRMFGIRGNFFATYPDHDRYVYDPYSLEHVNPDNDHYAQKHPDDDFAETFATCVDPTEAWRERYRRRSGALRKIDYVRHLIDELGARPPEVQPGTGALDAPVEEIRKTVAQFFRMSRKRYARAAQGFIDDDLKAIFRAPGRLQRPAISAGRLFARQRQFIETSVRDRIHPKDPRVVGDLLEKIRLRLRALDLVCVESEQDRTLAELYGLVLYRAATFHRFSTFREP